MKTDFLVGYKQERQDETDRRTKLVPKPRHMRHAVWNTASRTTIVQSCHNTMNISLQLILAPAELAGVTMQISYSSCASPTA